MGLDGPPKSLGILLSRGPKSADAQLVCDLARAAGDRPVRIALFLMAEGADLLESPVVHELTDLGVQVSVCTRSVTERGLPTDLEHVDYASQFQLGRLVANADHFVSFT
jgi:sulfur relay (sulfurtransferase) complex TusBCD TusD component (DsrE family)